MQLAARFSQQACCGKEVTLHGYLIAEHQLYGSALALLQVPQIAGTNSGADPPGDGGLVQKQVRPKASLIDGFIPLIKQMFNCLLYTSDAADE